ncbi:MAG: hypothetical protein ABSG76_04640 [Xanthobacteraceae bacterium]
MTKLLWKAIKKARELPAHDQDAVASVVLSMVDEKTAIDFDDEALAAIEEGLAQAELGGFVSDDPEEDIEEGHGEELPAYPASLVAGRGEGPAGGEGRVLHLLPVADQVGWIEPRPDVMSPAPGLVLPAADGTASAATLDQASNPPVTKE